MGSEQKVGQGGEPEHREQVHMLTYKKCSLEVHEDILLGFQSLFLHVILAHLTSFRNITVASVKKACCKTFCVGTELNFPKMWVVWTQCFSLLTPTETGPGINQMKT